MEEGFVISFEGIDTSGKSTQAIKLKERLEADGHKVVLFHFPMYERPIGNFIRSILLNKDVNSDTNKIGNEAMQMLYVADQLDFQMELKRYKDEGYIVILDRYDLSTLVYYSMMSGMTLYDAMKTVYEQWQKALMKPDVTVILNLDPDEIAKRKQDLDKFEKDYEAMCKASRGYLELYWNLKDRKIYFIDADGELDDIAEAIYTVTNKEIGKRYGKSIEC